MFTVSIKCVKIRKIPGESVCLICYLCLLTICRMVDNWMKITLRSERKSDYNAIKDVNDVALHPWLCYTSRYLGLKFSLKDFTCIFGDEKMFEGLNIDSQ